MGSGESVRAPPNSVPHLPLPTVARAHSSSAAVESSQDQVGKELTNFGPERVVLMEVAQSHTRATLSFRATVVTVESLDISSKTVDTRTLLLRWMREVLSKQA